MRIVYSQEYSYYWGGENEGGGEGEIDFHTNMSNIILVINIVVSSLCSQYTSFWTDLLIDWQSSSQIVVREDNTSKV